MPRNDNLNQAPESLIKHARPLLELGTAVVSIIVFCYSTFALKENIAEIKAGMVTLEHRCITYSDNNRLRMEDKFALLLSDVREQLSWLKERVKKGL